MWPEKKRRFNFLFRFFSTFSFDVLLFFSQKRRRKGLIFSLKFFSKREKKGGKNKAPRVFFTHQNSQTDHFIASLLLFL